MAVPVIESIAANLLATLNGVTTGNGYEQTIVIKRPSRVTYDTEASGDDLEGLLVQGTREPLEHAFTVYTWRQPFLIIVYALNDDRSATTIDTRLNQITADMEKALRADITRGAYAYMTNIGEPEFLIAADGSVSATMLPITVDYRVLNTDPYTKG